MGVRNTAQEGKAALFDSVTDEAAEAIFDLLCSVGENGEAVAKIDTLVQSFPGYDLKAMPDA